LLNEPVNRGKGTVLRKYLTCNMLLVITVWCQFQMIENELLLSK